MVRLCSKVLTGFLLAGWLVFGGLGIACAEDRALPRFLELGADKCMACKMMVPVLEGLRKDYAGQLQVDFIDVWKTPDEAKRYSVRMIPTQIFFDKEGKEIYRHTGYFPKEDIVKKFGELGIKL